MPWLLYSQGKTPLSTHWIGGWVSLRAGLNTGKGRKFIIAPARN